MKDNRAKQKNKKIVFSIISTLLIVFIIAGISYALFDFAFLSNNKNVISQKEMELEFLESSNEIIGITNAAPLPDAEGKIQPDTFDFQVRTKAYTDVGMKYSLVIQKLPPDNGYTLINDNKIKVFLTDYDNNVIVPPTLISELNNYVLYEKTNIHSSDPQQGEYKDKYKLRVWIDETASDNWTQDPKIQYNFKIGIVSNEKTKNRNLEDSTVTLTNTNYIYDGNAKTPGIAVKYGSQTLVKDTDYTVSYQNNTNAGIATVSINGKGNYTGTIAKNFIIDKAQAECVITNVPNLTYPKTATGNISYNCSGDGNISITSSDTSFMTVGTPSGTSIPITTLKRGSGAINIEQEEGSNYTKSNKITKTVSADLSSYLVNVTVENGTVTTPSKNILYGNSETFNIAANDGYGKPTVNCTNSQTANINDNNLVVSNVTNDTTCTVNYKKNPEVNVVVQNGIVEGQPLREIEYGSNVSFNIINNEGSDFTSVSCTNGQNGIMQDNKLTLNNVTSNTTCTVIYTERTYTVTYQSGNDNTASGVPSSQIKRYTKPLVLSNEEPTSTTNEFLGWSKTESATETNEWYDPSTYYTTNADATLYAQWYNVDALETEYTGFVRSGDFTTVGRIYNISSLAAWGTKKNDTVSAGTTGYTVVGHGGYNVTNASGTFVYNATDVPSQNLEHFWVRNAYTGSLSPKYTFHRIELLQRTGSITSGTVDERILNIQNVKNACLSVSNDDIYVRGVETGDFSVSSKSSKSVSISDTLEGYTLIGNVGFDVDNADTSGANINLVYVYKMDDSSIGIRNPYSSAAKLKATLYQLFMKNKIIGDATTPTYGSYSTLGQKRLSALKTLQTEKSNYFAHTDVGIEELRQTNLTTNSTEKMVYWTIPTENHRRVFGIISYGMYNDEGEGGSYGTIKRAYLSNYNSSSTTANGSFGRLYRQSNSTSYYSTGVSTAIYVAYIN